MQGNNNKRQNPSFLFVTIFVFDNRLFLLQEPYRCNFWDLQFYIFRQSMQLASSYQKQPWTYFPNLSYCFLNEGFLHKSKAVFKFTLNGPRGGAEIKEIINNISDGNCLQDETKLWLSLPGSRSFSAKLKTGEQIKLHYDNGITEAFGKKVNLYAMLNLSRQLSHLSWRFGLAHKGNVCHTDTRVMFGSQDQPNLTLYNRTLVTQGRLKYGIAAAYDLRSRSLTKNNLLLGWDIDDKTSLFLRAEKDKSKTGEVKLGQWKSLFDRFQVDIINKYDAKTQVGLEFAFKNHGKPFKEALVVLQRQFSEGRISKLQLSTNFSANLLLSSPAFFNREQCKVSLGLHAANLNRQNKFFHYGTQVEFAL